MCWSCCRIKSASRMCLPVSCPLTANTRAPFFEVDDEACSPWNWQTACNKSLWKPPFSLKQKRTILAPFLRETSILRGSSNVSTIWNSNEPSEVKQQPIHFSNSLTTWADTAELQQARTTTLRNRVCIRFSIFAGSTSPIAGVIGLLAVRFWVEWPISPSKNLSLSASLSLSCRNLRRGDGVRQQRESENSHIIAFIKKFCTNKNSLAHNTRTLVSVWIVKFTVFRNVRLGP